MQHVQLELLAAPTLKRQIKNSDYSDKILEPPSLVQKMRKKFISKKLQKYITVPTCEWVEFMAFNLVENLE